MGFWGEVKKTVLGEDAEKVGLDREDTNLEHGDANRSIANAGYTAAGNRAAPTAQAATLGAAQMGNAATIDQSQQAQFRQRQMGLADSLALQASGQGPSVAGAQFKAAADTNLAQQQALAASGRGGNAAMAGRQAAQNAGNFNQQAAQGAAIGRQQEQLNAQTQLGNLISQGRTSDIGLATSQAGLQQETGLANQTAANAFTIQQGQWNQDTNLANMKAQLEQTGMNDAQQIAYLEQLTGMDQAELTARMQQDQLEVSQRDAGSPGILGDLIAAGGTAGAAAITASDEKLKKNKKKSNMDDFLDKYSGEESKLKPLEKVGKNYTDAGDIVSEGTKNSGSGIVKAAGAIGAALLEKKGKDARSKEEKTRREFAGNMATLKNEADHITNSKVPGWKRDLEKVDENLLGASDVRLKKDVDSGDSRLDDFLSKITAYEYEYKDPEKFGAGKRVSPMAQDLEKSELGKEMVMETNEGKMVDYGKGLGTIVASLAHLNEKIEKLKKGKK